MDQLLNTCRPHIVEDFDGNLEFPCAVEPKYDGHRVIVTICPKSGHAVATTRRGRDVTSHMSQQIKTLKYAIAEYGMSDVAAFDGELCHSRGPRDVTSICCSRYHSRDIHLRYVVFDMPIPLNTEIYTSRRTAMRAVLRGFESRQLSIIESTIANSLDCVRGLYRHSISAGHEGIVVKQLSSCYGDSRSWVRVKPSLCSW